MTGVTVFDMRRVGRVVSIWRRFCISEYQSKATDRRSVSGDDVCARLRVLFF